MRLEAAGEDYFEFSILSRDGCRLRNDCGLVDQGRLAWRNVVRKRACRRQYFTEAAVSLEVESRAGNAELEDHVDEGGICGFTAARTV